MRWDMQDTDFVQAVEHLPLPVAVVPAVTASAVTHIMLACSSLLASQRQHGK